MMQASTQIVESDVPDWELKKLSPKHMQVAALLAQGVDRQTIAVAMEFTPEYVTMLQRQPLFKAYIKEMSEAVSVHLESLFGKSVEVIRDTMENGSEKGRLGAAKLQLEATGRVGRFQTQAADGNNGDRLEVLAERLIGLLPKNRSAVNGQVTSKEVISDAEVLFEQTGGGA